MVLVALEVVGFMNDDVPCGLGGLVELVLVTEGVLLKLVVAVEPRPVAFNVLILDVRGTGTDFPLAGFKGILLTVLVEVALFSELRELTRLFLELDF